MFKIYKKSNTSPNSLASPAPASPSSAAAADLADSPVVGRSWNSTAFDGSPLGSPLVFDSAASVESVDSVEAPPSRLLPNNC